MAAKAKRESYQLEIKFPKEPGGRFIAVYKTARGGKRITFMGTGLNQMAAIDAAARKAAGQGYPTTEIEALLEAHDKKVVEKGLSKPQEG